MPTPERDQPSTVAIFSPNPLVSVTIERRGDGADEVHLHAAGQGVWAARMAAELGARPQLFGLAGGEPRLLLDPLLAALPVAARLVETASPTGVYVMDRRSGEREVVAMSLAGPASRHELDSLVAATLAGALDARVLSLCGPFPSESVGPEPYAGLVADGRAGGAEVHVDLSPPRLDHALRGAPDLVKINDWQAAEYVIGPVDTPERLRAAGRRMQDAGAVNVVITRGGDPALALLGDEAFWIVPPSFPAGVREGCGDTMFGAIAAARADGRSWTDALVTGAAAGAVNFLRRGLGTGGRADVEEVAAGVELRPF